MTELTEWYTVTGLVEGAIDEELALDTIEDALVEIDRLQALYASEGGYSWDIYLLPHYCRPEDPDDECTCAQYVYDHRPVATSREEEWTH